MNKTKKIIAMLLIIVFSLTMSGCNLNPANKAAPARKVSLKIWRLFDSQEVMQPIIDDYISDRKSQYQLDITYEQKDYNEYVENTTNALAAGVGPDIWMIRNDWVAREYDKLQPVPKEISTVDNYKEIFPDIAVKDNIIDDKIYGIPLSIDTLALYYNESLFEQVKSELRKAKVITTGDRILQDPPATWEDVIQVTKYLTQKDGNKINRAGIALGTGGNIDNVDGILTAMMLQNHTQMISDDQLSATFNLAVQKQSGEPVYAGTKALEFFKSFSDPAKENYSWNNDMPNSVQAFIDGKAAMIIDYSYIQKTLFEKAPNLKYDIAPLPQIKDAPQAIDFSSYWVETVTNNCQNPDVAWDFINYVKSKKQDKYTAATKRPTSNKIDENEVPIVKERTKNASEAFKFQVNTAQNWYKGKFPRKVDEVIAELIDNTTIRNQNTQSAMDAAASKVTTLLQKEPY